MSHGTSIATKGRIFRALENVTRGLIFAGGKKPIPTAFVPTYGYEGTRYHGTITGTNLGAVTAVSLGTGITIESFTVDSATQISVIFRTDADPTAGLRDLTVYVGAASGVLADAFDLRLSDAIVLPSKKPAQQRMELVFAAKALVQYPRDRELVASVRVQHTGHSLLPAQATVQQRMGYIVPGQAKVQVRTDRMVEAQIRIQKMADVAEVTLVRDALVVGLVAEQRLEMADSFEISLEDRLSATLVDETMEEA